MSEEQKLENLNFWLRNSDSTRPHLWSPSKSSRTLPNFNIFVVKNW